MKTNSKQFNAIVYKYILDAIDSDGYAITTNSDAEKLQFLANTFKSEYLFPYNLKRYGTIQNVLTEWIMGIPSSFNIDFKNISFLLIN